MAAKAKRLGQGRDCVEGWLQGFERKESSLTLKIRTWQLNVGVPFTKRQNTAGEARVWGT